MFDVHTVFRTALRDDTLEALDAAEQALRNVERHTATETGMAEGSYAEAHQLIASSYERLARARQILEEGV